MIMQDIADSVPHIAMEHGRALGEAFLRPFVDKGVRYRRSFPRGVDVPRQTEDKAGIADGRMPYKGARRLHVAIAKAESVPLRTPLPTA